MKRFLFTRGHLPLRTREAGAINLVLQLIRLLSLHQAL
jgi:hypothetical protein